MNSFLSALLALIVIGNGIAETPTNVSTGLALWMERTSIIARIQTGIALQAGLMKDRISADDGLAELMNFGPLKLSQLAGLKAEQMDAFASNLKDIELDSASDASEKQIVMLDLIRKDSALIGTPNGFSVDPELFSTAVQLINETETLTNLNKILEASITRLNNAKDLNDHTLKDDSLDIMTKFGRHLSELQNQMKSQEELKSKLSMRSGGQIETQLQTLKPLKVALQMSENRKNLPTSKINPNAVKKTFDDVHKLIVIAKSASPDCSIVNHLVTSRVRPHRHTRKFTTGFHNGVSDVKALTKNLYDDWIERMFRSGENLDRLKNGLRPLLSILPKLEGVDEKLKTVSIDEAYTSVSLIFQLQQAMEKIDATPDDVSEVATSFDACLSTVPQSLPSSVYDPIRKLIEDAKSFPTNIITAQQIVQRVTDSLATLLTESGDLKEQIENLKTISDADSRYAKAAEIVRNVVKPNLPKLLLPYENLQKIIGEFSDVRGIFENVAAGPQLVKTFLKDAKPELDFYACLQKLNEKSEKVAKAFGVAQEIRKMVDNDVKKFKAVVNATVHASEGVEQLKGLVGEMKKVSGEETAFLNGMAEANEHSTAIGRSAAAFWSMCMLVEKKSSVEMLKKNGNFISKIIARVSDPVAKANLERVWTDHEKGIASVEAEVQKIEGLGGSEKQSQIGTLKEYGELLKELNVVDSVDFKVDEEAVVIETLIKTTADVAEQEQLLKLREALGKIAVLDLNFTGAHSAFDAAPASYTALFDFVNGGSSLLSGWPVWALVVGISIASAFLLAVLGLFFYFCIYPYFKTPNEVDIYYWIRRQKFKNNAAAEKYYTRLLKNLVKATKVDEAASLAYLPESKMRDPKIFCNPKTAVSVTKGDGKVVPVHANRFETNTGSVFIATQAPMDGKQAGKDDTLEDFIDLIVQQDSEFVIMLCRYKEKNAECPQYTPAMGQRIEIGRYTLSTMVEQVIDTKEVVYKSIAIVDKEGKYKPRIITHYQMTEWLEDFFPEMPHTIVRMLNRVNGSSTPVIVHCMTGVGRSVSFIALEYLTTEVSVNCTVSIKKVFYMIRDIRWHGIQYWFDMYYVHISALYKLLVQYDMERSIYWDQFIECQRMYDIRMDREHLLMMQTPEYKAKKRAELAEFKKKLNIDQKKREEMFRKVLEAKGYTLLPNGRFQTPSERLELQNNPPPPETAPTKKK